MVYCKKCGAELGDGAAFCQACGTLTDVSQAPQVEARKPETPGAEQAQQTPSQRVLDLAGWGDRIIAYIIDAVIVGAAAALIKTLIAVPSFYWAGMMGYPGLRSVPWMDLGFDNILYFIYFLWMDLSFGQSVGKMVMKIRVTNLDGGRINLTQGAIEVFGKAFLLPLDVIIGWFFLGEKSQRLFTFLAQTIVLKDRK